MESLLSEILMPLLFGLILIVVSGIVSIIAHILALWQLDYTRPWLPVIPFGRPYAIVDIALGGASEMYLLGIRVPAILAKLHTVIGSLLGLIPVVGWILSPVFQIGCAGPCYAWIFASLEGRDLRDTQLKGYLAAIFEPVATILLIINLIRMPEQT